MERTELPLVVIIGPTASGKTTLAVELAEKLGGEIICADSRTVYRGMDIGTAKPTAADRARVPHWGVDLVDPGQRFTAADFKRYADDKIASIRARGRLPFLVGGTGLYVDSVIFDYRFGSIADPERRRYLEGFSLEELYKYCINNNISLPENERNKRYVIRAIEREGASPRRSKEPVHKSIVVGLATDRSELRARIEERGEQIFSQDVVGEAIILGKKYGVENEAMTGNVYSVIREHLEGRISLGEAKERFKVLDWRLAKRQLIWMRSNPYIVWLSRGDVAAYIKSALDTG